MRLWIKLSLMIGLAVAVQWWADRNVDALEEAVFLVRIGYSMQSEAGHPSEDLIQEAGRLNQRQRERQWVAIHRAAGAGGTAGR